MLLLGDRLMGRGARPLTVGGESKPRLGESIDSSWEAGIVAALRMTFSSSTSGSCAGLAIGSSCNTRSTGTALYLGTADQHTALHTHLLSSSAALQSMRPGEVCSFWSSADVSPEIVGPRKETHMALRQGPSARSFCSALSCQSRLLPVAKSQSSELLLQQMLTCLHPSCLI